MADLKSELKLAREAIAAKDYKEALKHCRAALKIDNQNYNVRPPPVRWLHCWHCCTYSRRGRPRAEGLTCMASAQVLVLCGAASAGLQQHEQAEQAYHKAIEINEDSPVAWQVPGPRGICG